MSEHPTETGVMTGARVSPELRQRLEAAIADHPYSITLSQAVRRGLELVVAELEAMKKVAA